MNFGPNVNINLCPWAQKYTHNAEKCGPGGPDPPCEEPCPGGPGGPWPNISAPGPKVSEACSACEGGLLSLSLSLSPSLSLSFSLSLSLSLSLSRSLSYTPVCEILFVVFVHSLMCLVDLGSLSGPNGTLD